MKSRLPTHAVLALARLRTTILSTLGRRRVPVPVVVVSDLPPPLPPGIAVRAYGKYPGYADYVQGDNHGGEAAAGWRGLCACLGQFERSEQGGDALAELARLREAGLPPQSFLWQVSGVQVLGHIHPSHDRPDGTGGRRWFPLILGAVGAVQPRADAAQIERAIDVLAKAAAAMLNVPPVHDPVANTDGIPDFLDGVAATLAPAAVQGVTPPALVPGQPSPLSWAARLEALTQSVGGDAVVSRALSVLLDDPGEHALPPLGLWNSHIAPGRAVRMPLSAPGSWEDVLLWHSLLRALVGADVPIYVFLAPGAPYADIIFHRLTGAAFRHLFAPPAETELTTEEGIGITKARQRDLDTLLAGVRGAGQYRPTLRDRCRHIAARLTLGKRHAVVPSAREHERAKCKRLSLRQLARYAPTELRLAGLVALLIVLLLAFLLRAFTLPP